jgi:hypothetical protein
MAKIEFPTSPLFANPISARLHETVALIEAMTVDDAALYPERSAHDWPRLRRLGLEARSEAVASSAWWRIVNAVEARVQAVDPDAGDNDEAFCRPVYQVYGGHWLAVIEAAGLHVIEPLLPAGVRARFQPQVGLWPRHHSRFGP